MMIERRSPPWSGQRLIQSCNGKIGTAESATRPKRYAQSFGGQCVIVGEILRHGGCAVARVSDCDVSGLGLGFDEGFQIVPLTGNFLIQRVVDQNGQKERLAALPVRHLYAFFALE